MAGGAGAGSAANEPRPLSIFSAARWGRSPKHPNEKPEAQPAAGGLPRQAAHEGSLPDGRDAQRLGAHVPRARSSNAGTLQLLYTLL